MFSLVQKFLSNHVIPPKTDVPAEPSNALQKQEWTGDTAFQELIKAYKNDETRWVFVSDLVEFEQALNLLQSSFPDHNFSLEIKTEFSDKLRGAMEAGHHHENPKNYISSMGPNCVADFRLRVDNRSFDAIWSTNFVDESYFAFAGEGQNFKYFCGIGWPDDFKDTLFLSAQPLLGEPKA